MTTEVRTAPENEKRRLTIHTAGMKLDRLDPARRPGCQEYLAKRKLERRPRGESCRCRRLFSNIGIMYRERRYGGSDIPAAFITSTQERHP